MISALKLEKIFVWRSVRSAAPDFNGGIEEDQLHHGPDEYAKKKGAERYNGHISRASEAIVLGLDTAKERAVHLQSWHRTSIYSASR
jgi:hypothetical protein